MTQRISDERLAIWVKSAVRTEGQSGPLAAELLALDLRDARAELVALKAQRDELAAALKDSVCLHSCGLYAPIPEHWSVQTRQVIEAARAALAKVEASK